jgi:imidazolonepropionase-like amidohydrolase
LDTDAHLLEERMNVVIRGATVIDGTGTDPAVKDIEIREGRIASLGASIPSSQHELDGSGLYVIPGLIDCHVHAIFSGFDYVAMLMAPPALTLYRAIANLKSTLNAGITTVRDAGGSPAGLKLALREKLFPGPRMLVTITALSQTGGHIDRTMPNTCCLEIKFPDIPSSVVDGVEPMRQRVREILRNGADWIKVCSTGGVLSSADQPTSSQFTVDELRAAVEEGQAHGSVEVMAHAQGTQGIKNAIIAGVKSIEHGIWLDDEAIAMMKARDVYMVPTLTAPVQVVRAAEARPGSLPEVIVEKARHVVDDHRNSFRRAVEAGVKVAMGTDSGVGPHGENCEELELMTKHGMTPMEAIQATTLHAAKLLKLDSDLGTLECGKIGDAVLVKGNPLENIALLKDHSNIVSVIQGGEIVKNLQPERLVRA